MIKGISEKGACEAPQRDRAFGKDAWQASSYGDLSPTEISLARQLESEKTIWTRNYYEHIIRNDRAYRNIEQYIKNNPLQAQRALIEGACDAPQRDLDTSKGGSQPLQSQLSDAGLASTTSRTHAMRPNVKQKEK